MRVWHDGIAFYIEILRPNLRFRMTWFLCWRGDWLGWCCRAWPVCVTHPPCQVEGKRLARTVAESYSRAVAGACP
jgi:hypothetical protein